jgi:hypothetical protein
VKHILLILFPLLVVCPHLIPPNWLPDDKAIASSGPSKLPDARDKNGPLPDNAGMEKLAKDDPVAFLENSLSRYNREVKGYSLTMQKQERIGDKLEKKEVVDVKVKDIDDKISVFMRWVSGMRLAARVLYVEGENNDKMLVKPAGLGGFLIVTRDPEGADARKSGRYTLKQFGLKRGLQRTWNGFLEARKDGTLKVKYLGKQKVKEAGDRTCWVLERTYAKPDEDGVAYQKLFIDTDNWLLVGTILKGEKGELLAEYFFRDIRLNPEFDRDQFTRKALTAK